MRKHIEWHRKRPFENAVIDWGYQYVRGLVVFTFILAQGKFSKSTGRGGWPDIFGSGDTFFIVVIGNSPETFLGCHQPKLRGQTFPENKEYYMTSLRRFSKNFEISDFEYKITKINTLPGTCQSSKFKAGKAIQHSVETTWGSVLTSLKSWTGQVEGHHPIDISSCIVVASNRAFPHHEDQTYLFVSDWKKE